MRRLIAIAVFLLAVLCARAQTGVAYASDRLSSTLISCICQDKAGYIWIGTDYGLNRFDGYRFTSYLNNPADDTTISANTIVSMYCDREGRLWVGTSKGIQCYDYATDSFQPCQFPDGIEARVNDIIQLYDGRLFVGTAGYGLYLLHPESRTLSLLEGYSADANDNYFSHLYEDRAGWFWKGGSNSLTCRLPDGKIRSFSMQWGTPSDFFDFNGMAVLVCRDNLLVLENGQINADFFDLSALGDSQVGFRTAIKDQQGNIFVGTRGNGLFWIPAGTRRLVRYPCTAHGLDMNATKIWALAEDRQGNLWVGCQQKGLIMIPNRKAQFSSWSFSGQRANIGTFVSSICEGDNGLTWLTVQNKGVYAFDSIGRIVANPKAPADVEFLYRDSQNGYWLGTSHGVFSYNPATGASQLLTDFDCDKFNCMTDNGRGQLFFSVFAKGILMYDRQTRQLRSFSMRDPDDSRRGRLCNNWVMDMTGDREGNVWVATSDGVSCYNPKADTFKPYGWPTLVSDRCCYSLCETSDGNMLIGTERGLYVWYRKTNKLELFPHGEALQNVVIGYIVQDNAGDIWCSTSMGIWHYHAQKASWTSYVNGPGLAVHEYVNSAGLHTAADRIYFATNDGVTTFTPRQVHDVDVSPGEVHLTGFFIGQHSVNTLTMSGGDRVTGRPVFESDHFTVSYLENSLSLEFSLLNYANAANVIFEYRLSSDDQWMRNAEGQNTITLSHMASGTYQLAVRAIDNGVVSPLKVYTIVVTPPWYRSTWAYLLYLLGGVCLIALAAGLYRRRTRQQLDEEKMKFLINATHDIRSPLTLIMSPLAKLRRRNLDEESQADLTVIERNAQRILTLVNQILDVRKIDKQQMHLHCTETDMKAFVSAICKVYEYNAQERQISFTFTAPDEPVTAWLDHTQFDKVVSNLLSNAFKYSFDGGHIAVRVGEGHDDSRRDALKDYVEVTITDDGMGLREDTIQHIFDRFYQGRTSTSTHIEGTGIGLNLCKMVIDMHHGSITAANRSDGQRGSIFTVRLPKGKAHLSEAELATTIDKQQLKPARGKQQPHSNYRVLVVDDDAEIGRYISSELGAYYHFNVCQNGKEALKELLTNSYDVVVSDVLMPEMDGFTLLRMVKSNINISHIPVIMLTSKSEVANRLEGLERGADAYLTKPFSMEELHAVIDNQIKNHLRLKGKFTGAQQPTDKVQAIDIKGNDELLMERIMKSVNQHLSDSDYSVETMCDEVGISRAHLHRKMKEMTGIHISEFVRNIRMEQAALMISQQKLNVTQVAYAVGFSNAGYFSTVFRRHFGVSPTEYVEQRGEGTPPE